MLKISEVSKYLTTAAAPAHTKLSQLLVALSHEMHLLLSSAGHDCSIRLWNLESKTCIQEFTAHRKKFEEAIHDVAFHPSKCYIASAGADALAKVFV